jgi:hypothetical protein
MGDLMRRLSIPSARSATVICLVRVARDALHFV